MFEFITTPYTTRPFFKKLDNSIQINFNQNYITQKKFEIKQFDDLWATSDQAISERVIEKTAKHLGLTASNIIELGMQMEEDIVIIHDGKIQSLFVAFPSGWIPATKLMMTLEEIHKPVADNDALLAASSKISEIMCGGNGPWFRYVWTISSMSRLSNHPLYNRPKPTTIDDLYFRYEYQTFDTVTKGLTSVFLIKTVVTPFFEYIETNEKYQMIKQSINSMSDNILTYKNLHDVKNILENTHYQMRKL